MAFVDLLCFSLRLYNFATDRMHSVYKICDKYCKRCVILILKCLARLSKKQRRETR